MDVIVEMLANVNLSKDLQMLACGGRVTVRLQALISQVSAITQLLLEGQSSELEASTLTQVCRSLHQCSL